MIAKIFACGVGASLVLLAGCASATSDDAHSADSETGVVSPSPLGTTEHYNVVTFQPQGGMGNIFSFPESVGENYSITAGQPWGGASGQDEGGNYQIVVDAGRQDSSDPANWFNFQRDNAAIVESLGGSQAPSDLNFAFSGPLTIGGGTYNVIIGQLGGVPAPWILSGQGFTAGECSVDNHSNAGVLRPDRQYLFAPSTNSSFEVISCV